MDQLSDAIKIDPRLPLAYRHGLDGRIKGELAKAETEFLRQLNSVPNMQFCGHI